MDLKRWLSVLVSFLMMTVVVMQPVCISMTSKASDQKALGNTQNRLHQANESLVELEMRLKLSSISTTTLENLHQRRMYRAYGTNIECTSSTQSSCRRCTEGTVLLECVDGVGRRLTLQDCQHLPHPSLVGSMKLVTQNETTETYTLSAAVSCCATLHSLILCDCKPNFVNGSDCTQCEPENYGVDCLPCICSSHGECSDGHSGNGSCVCHIGWTGSSCDTCLPQYYGANCTACDCLHGVCSDGLEGQGCQCEDGWIGNNCDVRCDQFYAGHNCSAELQYHFVQKLLAPDGAAQDEFSRGGISFSSEGSFLSTGSYNHDHVVSNGGAVHVWRWNATAYTHVQEILAPDGAIDDLLGFGGVSLSENGTLLVSTSPQDDDLASNAGSIYVWRWNGTFWNFEQKLFAPDGAEDDKLGYGGATLSGDGNILCSASDLDDDAGSASGSVYVWRWNGSEYAFIQKLLAPDGEAGDQLGHAGVSLTANGSVLSAASHEDTELGSSSGSVYVWSWNGTSFVFLQKLLAPDGGSDDWLGRQGVSLSKDGSVLSVPSHTDGGGRGSLYVWRWNGTGYDYTQKLLAPDAAGSDYLGHGGVGFSEDGVILVSASFGDDDKGSSSGSVYVWRWIGNEYAYAQKLLAPDGAPEDYLGAQGIALTASGSTLSVSCHADDDLGSNSGSLYVAVLGWVDDSVSDHCIKAAGQSGCLCAFPFTGDTCVDCLPGYSCS